MSAAVGQSKSSQAIGVSRSRSSPQRGHVTFSSNPRSGKPSERRYSRRSFMGCFLSARGNMLAQDADCFGVLVRGRTSHRRDNCPMPALRHGYIVRDLRSENRGKCPIQAHWLSPSLRLAAFAVCRAAVAIRYPARAMSGHVFAFSSAALICFISGECSS